MSIAENLREIRETLPENVRLTAVSKFHPPSVLWEAYHAGQRIFGENHVQELVPKYEHLPKDVEWHFIGHLQANKVKYIAPFIHTIQSVDSLRLLEEINKQAGKHNRKINVFLQIHIAQETHKFGFLYEDVEKLLSEKAFDTLENIRISGLMGMATLTGDGRQIRREFSNLHAFFLKIKNIYFAGDKFFSDLSIGMSDDYLIAIEEGSTMVRIGGRIFGGRIRNLGIGL
ncbi:MAG: YggS family pyridoxal phosphate-dependent enzyme [Dysgonamonadaceae bacterium]|jgi:pyridoxal phosphate enzyme (YggS family)|nr:YggS family pyridoxal phosphate-dependent enzyme [Dysgonamonadaceae bacterium]